MHLPHHHSHHSILNDERAEKKASSGILTPNAVLSGMCRSTVDSRAESRSEVSNSLELEAIAAVHEMSFAGHSIA